MVKLSHITFSVIAMIVTADLITTFHEHNWMAKL